MVDFKAKLAQMKQSQQAPQSTFASKFAKPGLNQPASELVNKFQKRSNTTLEEIYNKRADQSKASGMGKSIFEKEVLEQYGIEEFQTTAGDRIFEILPVSFSPIIPYFLEVPVHYQVGFAKDAFLCLFRFMQKACFRCEQQQMGYRGANPDKEKLKTLYPADRIIYLLWERTKELIEGDAMNQSLSIWSAPKQKVHAEIQAKVHDKITKQTLDISSVIPNGEGRSVMLEIQQPKGEFPKYIGIGLRERTSPIPNFILEKLDKIITDANGLGFQNAIEMFLHIPEYAEVQESMMTEGQEESDQCASPSSNPQQSGQSPQSHTASSVSNDDETAFIEYLTELQKKLDGMSIIQWKVWCNKHNYAEALSIGDRSEAVQAIIDDMYGKKVIEEDIEIKG